jgi:hypothetical protein
VILRWFHLPLLLLVGFYIPHELMFYCKGFKV